MTSGCGTRIVDERSFVIKPTLQDVARLAGVSVSTASRVLAGSPRKVDPQLEGLVREHAAALGYRAHPIARALRRRETRQLGVLVPNLRNPYFVNLIEALWAEASNAGQSVLLAESHDDPAAERDQLETLADSMVDGIVVVPVSLDYSGAAIEESASRCPTVQADRYVPGAPCPFVGMDNDAGVEMLVDHLRARGRSITYVGAKATTSTAKERLEAFGRMALEGDDTLLLNDFSVNAGRAGAEQIVAQGHRHTSMRAVLAAADVLAIGLSSALIRLGVSVPNEITVASFDGTDLAELVEPPITTLCPPLEAIAAGVLAALGDPRPDIHERHRPTLIRRASSDPGRP